MRRAKGQRPVEAIKEDWRMTTRRSRQSWLFAFLDMLQASRFEEAGGRHCSMIAVAELEGLPFSISTLAVSVREPRSVTSRTVHGLMQEELVRLEQKNGKSTRIYLTTKGWKRLDRWWASIDGPIDHLIQHEGF